MHQETVSNCTFLFVLTDHGSIVGYAYN